MAKRSTENLSQLPLPGDVFDMTDPDERKKAHRTQTLLTEATGLLGAEARLKEIKDELKELLNGTNGTRYQNQCCIVRFQSGRKVLKPALLIENGVSADQITQSTVEGEGYWVCELPVIQ